MAAALVVLAPMVAAAQSTEAQSPPPAHQAQSDQGPLNPTQEIAKETPEGPAVVIGPTQLRVGGYIGLTGIYRSTNSGGGAGTSFGSVPYGDSLQGNVSETRLSPQSSRLSLRINAAAAPHRSTLAAYVEVDFNGETPGNVAVTSTGFGIRLRHVFGEGQFSDRYMLAAGQAFSLMTPARNQLSVWPSDYELSQAIDVNYLAGLVWGRRPQVRFTYRPSSAFNWAVSVENPEQQLGADLVKLPACCAEELGEQYNTGGNELRVPNFMPDIVSRAAFNSGSTFHLDIGGVFRVFRHTLKPYDETHKSTGGGISVDANVQAARGRFIGQVSIGAGMGRYIGGLVPDVTIDAGGEIHPIRTTSWVVGFEKPIATSFSWAAYYSGIYVHDSVSVDADGSYIGYGYPGAPNSNNKTIEELTGVFAWRAWNIAGRGSMQWNTQVSWLTRSPWSQGTGPASASAFLLFTQVRYNLP